MHFKKKKKKKQKERKPNKKFLKINNIEMYSTYNEGKSVVANILEI